MSIIAQKLVKTFGEPPTTALHGVDVNLQDGEFVAITGRSGSGKSTLLYLLSTLDVPTSGELEISGQNISDMTSEEVHRFRNLMMGFVFQFHYLLPELTALENTLMPALKTGRREERRPFAVSLLERFGLGDKTHRRPGQLSGGEQQRVSIARALVMEPRYLFADEPTGNLDTASGDIVMRILGGINREKKTTVVIVTHDPDYAAFAQRQIHLVDGTIASQ